VIACLIFVPLASACHDDILVNYINETSEHVTVLKDGKPVFDLAPQGTRRSVMFRKNWLPDIKVVTDNGRVLLEDNITIDELEAMKYRIVITDSGQP